MCIRKKRMEWEKRFPALDDTWNYWWIEADGRLIAVLKGSLLKKAVDIVEEYFENAVSIKVYRAKIDFESEIIQETGRNWEVARNWDLASERNEIDETFDPNR